MLLINSLVLLSVPDQNEQAVKKVLERVLVSTTVSCTPMWTPFLLKKNSFAGIDLPIHRVIGALGLGEDAVV